MISNTFKHEGAFELESGETLAGFELEYRTSGQLNASRDNVIWVCHALTANSDVEDWWQGLFGPGKLYDPAKYFIVCVNFLGSCYGSTGPASVDPATGKPYLKDFPLITIRDVVQSSQLIFDDLNLLQIHTLLGYSLGGYQAMEWAISRPKTVKNLILMATSSCSSPWVIAVNEAMRMAMEADPGWQSSNQELAGPGLAAARAIGMLMYRGYRSFDLTQSENSDQKMDHYRAASYQKYQGNKLADRFDLFSFYTITKLMDTHNVGRGRSSVEAALSKIEAETLVMGITSDVLFPVQEQEALADDIDNSQLILFESDYGHDGFLVETEKLTEYFTEFYQRTN